MTSLQCPYCNDGRNFVDQKSLNFHIRAKHNELREADEKERIRIKKAAKKAAKVSRHEANAKKRELESPLNMRMYYLEEKYKSLESKIADLESNQMSSSLESDEKASSLGSEIADLKSEIADLKSQISALNKNQQEIIAKLSNNIAAVRAHTWLEIYRASR